MPSLALEVGSETETVHRGREVCGCKIGTRSRADIQVVVVGGGVAGLGVAWALAERGRRVVVLEAGASGRGASSRRRGCWRRRRRSGSRSSTSTRSAARAWPGGPTSRDASRTRPASRSATAMRTLVVADDRDSARALRRLFQFQTEQAPRRVAVGRRGDRPRAAVVARACRAPSSP